MMQTLFASDHDAAKGYRRIDNITDYALEVYQRWYGVRTNKDNIFQFVYGLLHSIDYRDQFADDLKRSLPRIPRINIDDFVAFQKAG